MKPQKSNIIILTETIRSKAISLRTSLALLVDSILQAVSAEEIVLVVN